MLRVLAIVLMIISVGASAMNRQSVTLAPQFLQDSGGLSYIGFAVEQSLIQGPLNQLSELVGDTAFTKLRHNQAARDHHSFHITLINPFEYPDLTSIKLDQIPSLSFELIGLGQASKGDNQTFFVVASSPEGQEVRAKFGLKPKDFHVTLGFDKKDVFGVSKGTDSLVTSSPRD